MISSASRLVPAFHLLARTALVWAAAAASLAEAAPPYVFTHLAGPLGGWGNADGTGAAARFSGPAFVVTDRAGNIFVSDAVNDTIRKITPAGVVTTFAGTPGLPGQADGTGSAAHFFTPMGLAIAGDDTLYVADSVNCTIRKITPAGVVTTIAGLPTVTGSADGTGSAARFNFPLGLAMGSDGNLLVADSANGVIRKVTPAGVVTTFAGTALVFGGADGTGSAASFNFPYAIATDAAGNAYVTDVGAVRKITPAGVVTTLAGVVGEEGYADATGPAARFASPQGVVVDRDGNIVVTDGLNHLVRRISPAGVVSTVAGTLRVHGSSDGAGAAAKFFLPAGLGLDQAGNLIVADNNNCTIRKITTTGVVSTFAGAAAYDMGSADGPGAQARFNGPAGIGVAASGDVYIADTNNSTIRKISPAGIVSTLAGQALAEGNVDGTGPAARFYFPTGLTVAGDGKIYVSDSDRNPGDGVIRRILPTGEVSTVAGRSGSTRTLRFPQGVAVAPDGSIYFAESESNLICRAAPDGTVSNVAGDPTTSGSADGVGPAAQFNMPGGVALDAAGNLYVADLGNHTIRRIAPGGSVTTLAGSPGLAGSADGTGAAARFNYPDGLALDRDGNIFVADRGNCTIREVTPAGVVTTVAGTAGVIGGADGVGVQVQFNDPAALAFDANGNLYVTEFENQAVRKAQLAGPPVISTQPASQTVMTGDSLRLSVTAGSALPLTYQWRFNGQAIAGATDSSLSLTNVMASAAGDYAVMVSNSAGSVTSANATVTVTSSMPSQPPPATGGGGGGGVGGCFAATLLAILSLRRAREASRG